MKRLMLERQSRFLLSLCMMLAVTHAVGQPSTVAADAAYVAAIEMEEFLGDGLAELSELVPANRRDEFLRAMRHPDLKARVLEPMTELYARKFLPEELAAMRRFHDSELGRSVARKKAAVMAQANELIVETLLKLAMGRAAPPSSNAPAEGAALRLAELQIDDLLNSQVVQLISQALPANDRAGFVKAMQSVEFRTWAIQTVSILYAKVYSFLELDALMAFQGSPQGREIARKGEGLLPEARAILARTLGVALKDYLRPPAP